MGQYNLGSLNSQSIATKVVSAGDPVTLVLNHSTKNTVYIGDSASVGSGNLLDATPLDPYASIVVNGNADVYAIAAVPTQPATVYTYQNSINWTPKAVQPNIVDPHTPYKPGLGNHTVDLTVPPGAQGLFVGWASNGFSSMTITGDQSGLIYFSPSNFVDKQAWVPVLSDLDTTVTVATTTGATDVLTFAWLMNSFAVGGVESGQVIDVNILNQQLQAPLPVDLVAPNPLPVSIGSTVSVSETNKQLFANQTPININVSLASGASAVILPATAGVQYFIHGIRLETKGAETCEINIQDTNGNNIGTLWQQAVGTFSNGLRPPIGDNNFHGAPMPVGAGLQIVNDTNNAATLIGFIVYSQ